MKYCQYYSNNSMDNNTPELAAYKHQELSVEELGDAAAGLLRRFEVQPSDGRISSEPDPRLVRYYQTIGVLDKPLRYDGRRAVYGFKHLLQLVVVKRLQQEGHPLHLIQSALAGRSILELERKLSHFFGTSPLPPAPVKTHPTAGETLRHTRFRAASRVESHTLERAVPPPEAAAAPPEKRPDEPAHLISARVAPGVVITVDPAIVENPGSVISIVAAALSGRTEEPQ
jgi:DNA-binding transcriptional MerR regulator